MMEIGDTFTMPVQMRRKWWQFWRRREWTEIHSFLVTDISVGHPDFEKMIYYSNRTLNDRLNGASSPSIKTAFR